MQMSMHMSNMSNSNSHTYIHSHYLIKHANVAVFIWVGTKPHEF